jgi:hypothetical protein
MQLEITSAFWNKTDGRSFFDWACNDPGSLTVHDRRPENFKMPSMLAHEFCLLHNHKQGESEYDCLQESNIYKIFCELSELLLYFSVIGDPVYFAILFYGAWFGKLALLFGDISDWRRASGLMLFALAAIGLHGIQSAILFRKLLAGLANADDCKKKQTGCAKKSLHISATNSAFTVNLHGKHLQAVLRFLEE